MESTVFPLVSPAIQAYVDKLVAALVLSYDYKIYDFISDEFDEKAIAVTQCLILVCWCFPTSLQSTVFALASPSLKIILGVL